MRVVSSQSEADIRRKETRDDLRWALRELTANLLRIANRAGRPVVLMQQTAGCVAAFQAYVDAHGALPPSHEVHDMLYCGLAFREYRPWIEERRAEMEEVLGPLDDSELKRDEAMKLIRRGALQVVASMLLNQLPQQSRGESDIYAGIRELEEARANRRKRRVDATKLAAALEALKGPKKRNRKKTV
jgi:hypothetical protein